MLYEPVDLLWIKIVLVPIVSSTANGKLRHKVGNLALRKLVVKCKSYQSSFASYWKLMLPYQKKKNKKTRGRR